MNVAMTHLWSLPMWIMSLASASLLYFKCFSFPFGDLLAVCFPGFFLCTVLSAVNLCDISQCFIQSPLLFPPLSVCLPTLVHPVPHPGPSSTFL